MTKKQKKSLTQIIIAAVLFGVLLLVPVKGITRFVCYFALYAFIGFGVLKKAFLGILRGSVFDENFLMAVATAGAFALGVYTKSGDYAEGIAVMLFYRVGELFESIAVGKSRKSIAALMDIRPDRANLVTENGIAVVSPEEVSVGDIISVNPGERVPLDGIVLKGSSSLNTSTLTGESLPRDIAEGDAIYSGSINQTGVIEVRVTKPYCESTVSKILELVENAASKKAKSEAFISKFSAYYTPAVCVCALLLGIIPPIFDGQWSTWLYRALTFLVVSCPCALVISIPLTFFAGLGGASKAGILIKGANYFEALAKTDTVIFDKTGTLTKGDLSVAQVNPVGISQDELIYLACSAESRSNHPVALSLKKACNGKISENISQITEIAGQGITAVVDGKTVACGNQKLMQGIGADCEELKTAGTAVYVAVDGVFAGSIVFSDTVKTEAREAVAALKKIGITKTVMLTGDRESVARQVSEQVGTDEYYAALLPDEKVTITEKIMETAKGKTLFVGDGINDSPVLTRADMGIAMGGKGSDSAIEAADGVLMQDNPMQVVQAIKISRRVLGIVYQNIIFALTVKFACLALTALGITDMWLAVFADVGVMVIAVLNAIRALQIKNL